MSKSGDDSPSHSKSLSKRRNNKSSTRKTSASDGENEKHCFGFLPGLEEKLHRMNASSEGDNIRNIHHSPSIQRLRRSSSRKSRGSDSVLIKNEWEDKMLVRMQASESIYSGRRHSRQHSSSATSDEKRKHCSRTSSSSTNADVNGRGPRSTRSSTIRSLDSRVDSGQNSGDDATAASLNSNIGSLPDLATIDPELSITASSLTPDDSHDILPGAYRVSGVGEVSVPSSSLHGRRHRSRLSEDSDSVSTGTVWLSLAFRSRSCSASTATGDTTLRSNNIRTALRSVSEEQGTVVQAEVASDHEEALEQARQRGRLEALHEVTSGHSGEIIVALPTEEDDDDDENKIVDIRWTVLFVGILVVAIVVAAIMLRLGGVDGESSSQLDVGKGESNAKVVVFYTPPTPEECEAIAKGFILENQQSLIQKSFYIHYHITLASKDDLGPLMTAMLKHIQENLIPIMAGCGAMGFFGTSIPIDDDLKNTTDSIVNGQVAKKSEQSCEGGSNGSCRSYILILDLYLKEEKSTSSLIEVIGNAVNGEEIVDALGSEFPCLEMVVNVPMIEPVVGSFLNDTVATTVPGVVSAFPTQAPTINSNPMPSTSISTAKPTMGVPPMGPQTTPRPSKIPTISVLSTHPTEDNEQTSSSNAPSRATSPLPSNRISPSPTAASSKRLSANPTEIPTLPPTPPLSFVMIVVPTESPTMDLTRRPTRVPSISPSIAVASTNAPSKSPTEAPSSSTSMISIPPAPTMQPTLAPTPIPTEALSSMPSKAPTRPPTASTTSPSSIFPTSAPTKAPTQATWCCSDNYRDCDGGEAYCNYNEFNCEVGCMKNWIQLGACTGLAQWDECTNDESGCCSPAVCHGTPGYKQCT